MTTIKTEGLTFLQKLKNLQDIMGEYAWVERWCPVCERKDTAKSGRRNDCPLKLVGESEGEE